MIQIEQTLAAHVNGQSLWKSLEMSLLPYSILDKFSGTSSRPIYNADLRTEALWISGASLNGLSPLKIYRKNFFPRKAEVAELGQRCQIEGLAP